MNDKLKKYIFYVRILKILQLVELTFFIVLKSTACTVLPIDNDVDFVTLQYSAHIFSQYICIGF